MSFHTLSLLFCNSHGQSVMLGLCMSPELHVRTGVRGGGNAIDSCIEAVITIRAMLVVLSIINHQTFTI